MYHKHLHLCILLSVLVIVWYDYNSDMGYWSWLVMINVHSNMSDTNETALTNNSETAILPNVLLCTVVLLSYFITISHDDISEVKMK